MRLRSARPTGPRQRYIPASLSIQTRAQTTMPFRLPDARNEPNVSDKADQKNKSPKLIHTIASVQKKLPRARQTGRSIGQTPFSATRAE